MKWEILRTQNIITISLFMQKMKLLILTHQQDYLKINVVAKNPKKLHYYINLAINNPRNKIWIKQYNNFKSSNEKFNIQSSKQTANLMIKIENNMNK